MVLMKFKIVEAMCAQYKEVTKLRKERNIINYIKEKELF